MNMLPNFTGYKPADSLLGNSKFPSKLALSDSPGSVSLTNNQVREMIDAGPAPQRIR